MRHAAAELVEIGDHHVGRQRQAGARVQLGHAFQARRRVFVVLQIVAEQFAPCASTVSSDQLPFGSMRSGVSGKACFSALMHDTSMLRREHAGLQLDALEAVGVDHPPRLGDDLLLAQRLAPKLSGG